MRILYTKPELVDLSQGSRIAFARQFRFMTQDDVSDKLEGVLLIKIRCYINI